MNIDKINQILADTAYVRMGGSDQERECAEYLQSCCRKMGFQAEFEPFPVDMADLQQAILTVDGREIPCKGYLCAGTGEVEAQLTYLANTDAYSLKQCAGKIVMIDGYLGYWMYQDLLENGAVGFITYDGNANYPDRDIDQRELRGYVSQGRKLPGVNINVKDAVQIIRQGSKRAKITLCQNEYIGQSHNVVMEMPGETDEWIVLTAHYDSTSLSNGAYDNMSGCIGLIGIAEYFSEKNHRYGLRFIWCGSEERGLLGSKAYCAAHKDILDKIVLNINLDMIGSVMGKFIACCTAEEKLAHYIEYFASEQGFGISASDGVYSSDSTPFADQGIPAVSFARIAPNNTATIHNSYDTLELLKAEQLAEDVDFLSAFADRMANARQCPVKREMPEKMKEKLDIYLCRKRDKN